MRRRKITGVPRWLFYFAVGASWLFGAEIVVLTAARKSLPGRLPSVAGWLFVAAIAISVVAMARLEMMARQKTANLVEQLEEALNSITALTEASLSSLDLPDLLDRFLERLVTVLHTEFGAIFLVSDSATSLDAITARGLEGRELEELKILISDNDGLIGRVVATEALIVTMVQRDLEVLSKRSGRQIASAAACPIVVEGRVIGVCVAATDSPKTFDERELHLMQLVADRSGLGIERRRLDEAERRARLLAERAHRYAVVLATASASLATARADFEANLALLIDVVVPAFCDWCAIDVSDGTTPLRRLAVRHLDDAGEFVSAEMRQRIPLVDAFANRAFATGQTQRSSGFLITGADGPGDPAARIVDPTPWISVPIGSERGAVGAMTFAFDGGVAAINADMIATAEDIARRIAIVIDRVHFYQEAQESAEHSRRVAGQLQQLLDASLEVSQLVDDSTVISAIVARAISICDAKGAAVAIESGSKERLCAIAEQGESVRVGNLSIVDEVDRLPPDIESLRETSRFDRVLATPIMGSDGESMGIVVIWRDEQSDFAQEDETMLVLLAQTASTALGSVELYRTIQSSEARWRTLIETAPIGVMEIDLDRSVQWANRSAIEIFGRRGATSAPASAELGIRPGDIAQLELLWSRAATGLEMHDRELLGVRVGDELKDLLVSVVPLYRSDRSVQGILTLVADVSDRRRLEGQLQQAQRMEAVGQLAGNVAHDFNNLLTLISGYTELLRSYESLDERQLDLVNNIQGVTDRAAMLTGRLLTISRRDTARPEVINPAAALDAMMEVLGKILGDNVELVHDFGDDEGYVSIDPAYFDQIILNLAVNARDAMPDGGIFTVSLKRQLVAQSEATRLGVRPGEMVEIIVSDTGAGMDSETASRCFDPFFTTKGPSKGTGLGLAAVRGIIVEGGGSIEVRSTPGAGTSFVIYLPVSVAIPATPSVARGPVSPVDPSRVNVLVAEDDDTLRAMIEKVLVHAGYHVLSAGAGDAALELAKDFDAVIDMLVTDVAMPGMNGPDLARSIEALSPNTAVLFISSNTAGIVVPTSRAGRSSFLAKPFRPSELVERVEEILSAHGDSAQRQVDS